MRLLPILLSALAVLAQQPGRETPVFHAGVAIVRVDVLVTEGQRPVDGLGKDDFIVYDEGVPQNVVHFGGEAEPIWLALLLDVSGSITAILHEIAAVAGKALDLLGPQDQVAVMAFGDRKSVV